MSIINEANILVKSWSGHLDAPTSELRMIENLIREIEELNIIVEPLIEVRQSYHQWLKPLEEMYFKKLMEILKNNQSKVSVATRLNRGTIRKKLKLYNLI